MQNRFEFRQVNELTGFLVVAVLALVVFGIVFSEHSQQWFTRKYSFDVRLPEQGALGLRSGADVIVLGVSAGVVGDITVDDDGRMTAHVKIRRDFARFLRANSTASIKKVFGVAGDSYMEISRGTGDALPPHKPEIACLVSEDSLNRMEEMLADLHGELVPVVAKAGEGVAEWTSLGAGELTADSRVDRTARPPCRRCGARQRHRRRATHRYRLGGPGAVPSGPGKRRGGRVANDGNKLKCRGQKCPERHDPVA